MAYARKYDGVTDSDDDKWKNKHGTAGEQDIEEFLPSFDVSPKRHTLLERLTVVRQKWLFQNPKNKHLQTAKHTFDTYKIKGQKRKSVEKRQCDG